MAKSSGSTALTLTLLLGIFVQVLLGFADTAGAPHKTAVEFSKAYFMIDPSVSQYLCSQLVDDPDQDVVGRFLARADRKAESRGFSTSYLRSYLFHVTTETLELSEDAARIRIHARSRTCINPVFAIIAKIFFIGETRTVEEVIDLIREDGQWKVCGTPFSMT